MLHFVSSFNLMDGASTEKVALPQEVENFSIPKQSIENILTKSISNPNDVQSPTTPLNYETTPLPTINEAYGDNYAGAESKIDEFVTEIGEDIDNSTDDDVIIDKRFAYFNDTDQNSTTMKSNDTMVS